jgi:hypothetical protein
MSLRIFAKIVYTQLIFKHKGLAMCNTGFFDRFLRVFVGGLLVFVAVFTGWLWGYIGLIPLVTGLFGYCPIYSILHINTGCKA